MTDSPADSAECRVCGTVALEVFFPFFFVATRRHTYLKTKVVTVCCVQKKNVRKSILTIKWSSDTKT